MDKPIIYKKDKTIKIVDYKSSKQKFRGEELTANIQAMSYSLASSKLWPKFKPTIEFLFLRFPKSAIQQCVYAVEELEETARLFLLLQGMNTRFLSSAQVTKLQDSFPT